MKRYIKFITNLLGALALIIMFTFTMDAKAESIKTYTVTLRTGNVGSFDTSKLGAMVHEAEVSSNYIKFQVARGSSLLDMGFFTDTAALNGALLNAIVIDGSYVLNSAEVIAKKPITSNTEYVLDYGKLVDPVEYRIYFADVESGEQIAAPTLAYGNAGDTIEVSPLNLTGYETSDTVTKLSLLKEKENTITFYYTFTGGTTESTLVTTTEAGETITNTVVNEIPTTVPAVTPATPATPGADAGIDTVEIEEEETPLADTTEEEQILEEIEDEEVPLAGGEEDLTTIEDEEIPLAAPGRTGNMVPIMIGIGCLLVTLGGVILLWLKKKTGNVPKS